MDDQRIAGGTLQDGVALAGEMIGRLRVGEREAVGRVEMILVLLARRIDEIGEAVIHPHQSGAGDMRQDAVEDAPLLGILVEAAMNEIADASPGLRAAPAIGLVDGAVGFPKRIDLSRRIDLAVSQEADEVAHRDVAEAEDERIPAGVDELVDPTRRKPVRHVDVPVGGHQRPLAALIVEPAAALDAGEAPLVRRHDEAGIVGVAAAGERRFARLERYGRVTARRDAAAERECGDAGLVGDVLDADRAGDRAPVLGGYRQIEEHAPVARQHVALPGKPRDCIAAPHQEAVAGMGELERIVARRRVVEELQRALVAAIAVVEEEAPVAARQLDRLQDHEIGDETDAPVAVARRLGEIGDAALRGRRRIDGEMRPPDKPLIGADAAEGMAAGEGASVGDGEFDDIIHICPFRLPRRLR